MISVREIITEALARANIVPRRQAAPGHIVEETFKLLKGIASKYNTTDYLSFTQNEKVVPYNPVLHIVTNDDPSSNSFIFDDELITVIPNVAKINKIYVPDSDSWYELLEEPYQSFDGKGTSSDIYTVLEKSEGEWLIKFKVPSVNTIKILYNEALTFDINSNLYISDSYTELFILALTKALVQKYPRNDNTMFQNLSMELAKCEELISVPKAAKRRITRDSGRRYNVNDLITGRFIFNG